MPVAKVHPGLIPGFPLHGRAARLQHGFNLHLSGCPVVAQVVIDDVYVVERRAHGLSVEHIPDGIT